MLYKACPKCRGDLQFEPDLAGGPPDVVCLQCGYRLRAEERESALTRLRAHARNHRARKAAHRIAT
jgi:hypothetical protein